MSRHLYITACLSLTLAMTASRLAAQNAGDESIDAAQEKIMKAALVKVAPCVVQIQTAGGLDTMMMGQGIGNVIRKGTGPTSGLIVAADGYIISSAFNFAHKPSEIFVTVPGQKDRYFAKAIATDQTRMLTLLKIEAKDLPIPTAVPRKEIKVGQWSMALGRTWGTVDSTPSMSVGIISAIDRIWGKAIQTDAKVSPVNYGGPLVDMQGRVQGVLVPASPREEGETAGHEWYDSGIGFAIPLEDINAVLPRLKQGHDLKRGYLGVTPKGGDIYGAAAEVGTVAPNSAAAHAGIKPGDIVVEVDGVKISRQAQVMHQLGRKYIGDSATVKVKRGSEELSFPNLTLTGLLVSVDHPFLGILPMRDDPELGAEIRFVYPKSPAETAGLKPGDRIMSITVGKEAAQPFAGGDGLMALLNPLTPGTEIKLDVRHKDEMKNESVTLKLAKLPETIPDQLPEVASAKKALEPRKTVGAEPKKENEKGKEKEKEKPKEEEKKDPNKVETGVIKRNNAAGDHEYWIYVPENYDPNIAHALVIWLHPVGKAKEKDADAMVSAWQDYCTDNHIILLGPKAVNDSGWLVSEADFVREAAREVMEQYTIDRQRVIAHGMDVGGQLAFYLGFSARDLIRGVATTGAVAMNQPKENLASDRLSFFIVAGGKDPRIRGIVETKDKIQDQKFPVIFRELPEMGHQYLDAPTIKEMARWIDSLDRL